VNVARRCGGLFAFFGGQDQAASIIDGVLLLIPFVMLSRTVLSMSDEEWDAQREPRGGPAPAATVSV
jgi:hypothetical protein